MATDLLETVFKDVKELLNSNVFIRNTKTCRSATWKEIYFNSFLMDQPLRAHPASNPSASNRSQDLHLLHSLGRPSAGPLETWSPACDRGAHTQHLWRSSGVELQDLTPDLHLTEARRAASRSSHSYQFRRGCCRGSSATSWPGLAQKRSAPFWNSPCGS